MERRYASRLTGVIYIVGAIFGLIISLGGLVVLWSTRHSVTTQLTGTVELVGRTLSATHDTITVTATTLRQASTDLDAATKIVGDVSNTLENSSGLIRSSADLVGNNMVGFVTKTQTSLRSVQTSAKVVDDFLRIVSSIPLIGSGYKPDVPLQDSIANVNKSLEPLPDAFTRMRRDLEVSARNVDTLKTEVEGLTTQIQAIQTSLTEAQRVIDQYQGILADMQQRYDHFQARLPLLLNTLYLGLTFVLIWIFINQLGMLIHGIEMWRSKP